MACTYATAARLIARVTTEPTSTDLERLRCTVCGLTAADYYAVRREEDPKTGRRDRVYLCERCYRDRGRRRQLKVWIEGDPGAPHLTDLPQMRRILESGRPIWGNGLRVSGT